MSYTTIPHDYNDKHEINTVIEIPMQHDPVKYEIDKDIDNIRVSRFVATAMFYPTNYGYVPNTLCGDGDPLDTLVITPYPLLIGSVIRVRPLGVLLMEDESGEDSKILMVPVRKVTTMYDHLQDLADVPALLRQQLEHYFTHYKDLEPGKWVKVKGWQDKAAAIREIVAAIANYK